MECPMCEVGKLTRTTYQSEFHKQLLTLECCKCDNCTEIIILTDQIKRNQVKFNRAREEFNKSQNSHIEVKDEPMGILVFLVFCTVLGLFIWIFPLIYKFLRV